MPFHSDSFSLLIHSLKTLSFIFSCCLETDSHIFLLRRQILLIVKLQFFQLAGIQVCVFLKQHLNEVFSKIDLNVIHSSLLQVLCLLVPWAALRPSHTLSVP